tara:strand:+ start:276 stop:473 length:198 start_codon:yes stop_codon:yes gene_type:complete
MKEFFNELRSIFLYFFIPTMLWLIYAIVLLYLIEIESIKRYLCIALGALLAYGTYVFIDKFINPK